MEKPIMKTGCFDTHAVVKPLQGAGLSIEAAEEITQSILLGRDYDISMLASKTDFFELKESITKVESEIVTIKGEIEALRTETRADIEALKKEIVAELAQHIRVRCCNGWWAFSPYK
ncbi:MAG: CCDC90 family protein [Candidatus Midichloria sp.]|nr:CCDC90 family protein [Candidatus Midichloria sp.]